MTRSIVRWSALVCCVGGLQGCGGGPPDAVPGVTDSTITLGTWAPLTGPAALWGAVGRGVDAYFSMINEQGGIHGRTFDVIIRDDGYQPSRTVPAVREMVERDRVFAMIAGVGTAPGMAVRDYLTGQGVPWVSPATGNTNFTYPPVENIFSIFTPYYDEAAALAGYALDSLGRKRIAVVYQNDDFGRSGLAGVQLVLEQRGLDVVAAVPVEVTDSDLSSHALRMSEANADAVLVWLTPRHGAIIRGAAARMGFEPQWLASTVLGDFALMNRITDGAWAGTIGASSINLLNLDDERIASWVTAALKKYPDEGSVYFLLAGFAYSEIAAAAFQAAGRDLTRANFLDALAGLGSHIGVLSPPSTFSPEKHMGTRNVFLYRVLPSGRGEQLTDWLPPSIDLNAAIARATGG